MIGDERKDSSSDFLAGREAYPTDNKIRRRVKWVLFSWHWTFTADQFWDSKEYSKFLTAVFKYAKNMPWTAPFWNLPRVLCRFLRTLLRILHFFSQSYWKKLGKLISLRDGESIARYFVSANSRSHSLPRFPIPATWVFRTHPSWTCQSHILPSK